MEEIRNFDKSLLASVSQDRPRSGLSDAQEATDATNSAVNEFYSRHGVILPDPVDYAADTIKVTALQSHGMNGRTAANYIDELLTLQKAHEGRIADILIMPENWLHDQGDVSLENNPGLRELSQVIAKHSLYALLGTMREFVEKKVYVTAVFMDTDGSIVGSYRKRKPTMEGAHAAGDKVGVFDTKFGRIGVMICFDIENEDILHETLALDPVIMLNPTWIPSPPIMKGPKDGMSLSTWRTGMETMSRLFEQRCVERGMHIIRCDTPFPIALGTSQIISPCFTAYVPSMMDTYFSGYIPKDSTSLARNRFADITTPSETQRTDRKDRTGSRYTIRSFPGHKGAILDVKLLDPIMKAASASSDRTIKVWNVNTAECLHTLTAPSAVLNLLAPKTSKDTLWSCALNGSLQQWNLTQWKNTLTHNTGEGSEQGGEGGVVVRLQEFVGEGENNNGLLCGCTDGQMRLFDPSSSAFTQVYNCSQDGHNAVLSLANNGLYIAAACHNIIQVWDPRNTSEPVGTLAGHNGVVSGVHMADNNHLLSSSYDGTVRLWDLSSLRCLGVAESQRGNALTSVVPMGVSAFITTSVDGSMGLIGWEKSDKETMMMKGTTLHTFRAHSQALFGVGYNGKERLCSFGQESEWRMWFITRDRHPISLKDELLWNKRQE